MRLLVTTTARVCKLATPSSQLNQHARVHDRRRIEGSLDGGESFAECWRSLAPVPRHVRASDRMMVRDRTAGAVNRLGGCVFDDAPLRELVADARRADE